MDQILLVEGKDDQHVIWALCQRFNLAKTFEVKDTGGVSSLLKQLPVRLKATGIRTIGIIVDADVDMAQRWQQIHNIISSRLPNAPTEIPNTGLIHGEHSLKVGVWLMPDNQHNGMLEHFMAFLVPKGDDLLREVELHLQSIEEKRLNGYLPVHRDKAKIHACLALQEAPGTPLGLSITKRYLDPEVEECQRLVRWLNDLFT